MGKAKKHWTETQVAFDANLLSIEYVAIERELTKQYYKVCKDEEDFYEQRYKIQWLDLGDQNTKFFYKSLNHRQVRNKLKSLKDESGTININQ